MKRVAFCLRGAVAKEGCVFHKPGALYDDRPYVDFRAVAASVKKHIFACNPTYEFDVFIHCWNADLRDALNGLYAPVAHVYEDNDAYRAEIAAHSGGNPDDFTHASHALSLKKVIELVEGTGARYDVVVLYRPDVLLYKDMDLATYDVDACVYVNAHPEGNGDFHFVMSMANASAFKGLYASATDGNPCRVHYWIKNYVENYLHLPLRMDALAPGPHAAQEVMRKLSPRRRREIIATF